MEDLEIIVETAKNSTVKYVWNEQRQILMFKKCMPAGFVFPFNFGMVPGTCAEDDDPLDVLLLMQEPVVPGSFVSVRLIGALKAMQKQEHAYRNDRLIAVENTCPVFGHYHSATELTEALRKKIEDFFRAYNLVQGKEFTPIGWCDGPEARELIEQSKK